jgi:hypothetical protein
LGDGLHVPKKIVYTGIIFSYRYPNEKFMPGIIIFIRTWTAFHVRGLRIEDIALDESSDWRNDVLCFSHFYNSSNSFVFVPVQALIAARIADLGPASMRLLVS